METHKTLIETYIKAYNDMDVAGMLAVLHQEVVFENVSSGQITLKTEGRQAFEQQAQAALDYFQWRQQVLSNWHGTEEVVKVDIEFNAMMEKDLPGGLQAGSTLHLTGSSEFHFQDDLIILIRDIS